MGEHITHNLYSIGEFICLLEDILVSKQQPPVDSQESFPSQPLVDNVVEMLQYSVNPTLPLESDVSIAHIFFANSYFSSQGGIPPSLIVPHPSPKLIFFIGIV